MDSVQLDMGEKMPAAATAGRKGISGSTIKIIAVAAMLIDHIAAAVLMRQIVANGFMEVAESGKVTDIMNWLMENGVLYYGYTAMRMIGRLGFPIFCFLLVEGFQRTRNVKKYALRLAAFALISEIPFDLAFKGEFFFIGYQNVYFTLLLGLLALCGIDWLSKHEPSKAIRIMFTVTGVFAPGVYLMAATTFGTLKDGPIVWLLTGLLRAFGTHKDRPIVWLLTGLLGALAAGVALLIYRKVRGGERTQRFCAELTVLAFFMCVAEVLITDYAGMGVLTIGVMYFYRKRKVISMLAGCIVLTILSVSEITAFFTLIPIALYNGRRGLKMKYFFYAFYPVHLALLYLISVWLGLAQIAMP